MVSSRHSNNIDYRHLYWKRERETNRTGLVAMKLVCAVLNVALEQYYTKAFFFACVSVNLIDIIYLHKYTGFWPSMLDIALIIFGLTYSLKNFKNGLVVAERYRLQPHELINFPTYIISIYTPHYIREKNDCKRKSPK